MRSITEEGGEIMVHLYWTSGAPSKDGSDGVLVGMDASQSAMGCMKEAFLKNYVEYLLGKRKAQGHHRNC